MCLFNFLKPEGLRPVMVSRTMGGFTINIIDTPGLVEAGYVNHQALELIKGSGESHCVCNFWCVFGCLLCGDLLGAGFL